MASQLFLEKIQGSVIRGDQFYSYHCSFLTRNGPCASERGLNSFGPKNLTACRRHGRMYEEELENLKQRLKMDHDQGMHGQGEARQPFAEQHTDDSGFFSLRCHQCAEDMKAEELGVPADKLERAQLIQRYVESIQTSRDNANKNFMEYAEAGRIVYAMERYGEDVRKYDRQAAYIETMLERMKGAYGEEPMDIVDAYDATAKSVKDNLLKNHLDEEADRAAAARFINLGSYY